MEPIGKLLVRRSKGGTRCKRTLFVIMLSAILLFATHSPAQQLTGTYKVSAPEASLFFLNPGYLNPALGNGVLGLRNNPAALRTVDGRQLAVAFGLPQGSDGDFSIRVTDSTDVYDAVTLDTRMEIRELGGLAGLGYAQQFGRWRLGIALTQAGRGGITLQAKGSVKVKTRFQSDVPITRDVVPDLPVEEIPITWDIDSDIDLSFESSPADLYLSILPITAGVSYKMSPLTLGVGLTYYHISSGNKATRLSSHITGSGSITGTPSGMDPLTGQPWRGTITADFSIDDQPLIADYLVDLSGSRFALSAGGMLNLGPISFGAAYSHGFSGNVHGNYKITTIHTAGLPDTSQMAQAQLNWTNRPELSGHATLRFADFQKDTVSYEGSGDVQVGGFHSYSFGIHFLILGAFVGGEIPQVVPDLTSVYFGAYLDLPLPFLPIRVNTGFIQRMDGIRTEDDFMVPYRIVTHVGAGVAVKLPLSRWLWSGKESSWLRVGVRSSLASLAMEGFEEHARKPGAKSLPPLYDTLALSMGLEVPF